MNEKLHKNYIEKDSVHKYSYFVIVDAYKNLYISRFRIILKIPNIHNIKKEEGKYCVSEL